MTCYFPLNAYKGKSNVAEKTKIVFRRAESWKGERLDLPCGQCIGCRLERSRQWAVRCMHEASLYNRNCFLTLTYDEKNLPQNLSLDKTHYQNFMKRLRKKHGAGIRYYHCGEYGEVNARPHYHALLFNFDFEDKKFFSERNGNRVYTSDELSSLWQKGFGVVGEVTFESAAYVARYVMKKVTGDRAKEHYQGRIPEYTTMSRRPGIGRGWYEKYKTDVYPRDWIAVRGSITRPPCYYDHLLGREDRSTLELLKLKRLENGNHYVDDVLPDGRRVKVSDNSSGRLAIREEVKRAEISFLKREI